MHMNLRLPCVEDWFNSRLITCRFRQADGPVNCDPKLGNWFDINLPDEGRVCRRFEDGFLQSLTCNIRNNRMLLSMCITVVDLGSVSTSNSVNTVN